MVRHYEERSQKVLQMRSSSEAYFPIDSINSESYRIVNLFKHFERIQKHSWRWRKEWNKNLKKLVSSECITFTTQFIFIFMLFVHYFIDIDLIASFTQHFALCNFMPITTYSPHKMQTMQWIKGKCFSFIEKWKYMTKTIQ